jgi:Spy/CpxP family protein refolding chaperone
MKRLIIFLGILVLSGAIAAPLSAQGWRDMGFGPRMNWGPNQDIHPRMGGFSMRPWFNPLTEKQRTQLDELNERFLEETAEFREALSSKSKELETTLTSEKPDEKKAKALQKEISDLQTKLAEKRLNFRLETAKIIPDSSLGRGFERDLCINLLMGGFPKRPGFCPLTEEQRTQLNALSEKFWKETAELRENLSSLSRELSRDLTSKEPDEKKAKALQKKISELRGELAQKTLGFQLDLRKILPETTYAGGYGRGFGPYRGCSPHLGRDRGMGRAPRNF